MDNKLLFIAFPDPKYYMIGFSADPMISKSNEETSDMQITQTNTKDTLKQPAKKPSTSERLQNEELATASWRQVAAKLNKPVRLSQANSQR
jgi:hypothetical protein